jgi:hypothetical protein
MHHLVKNRKFDITNLKTWFKISEIPHKITKIPNKKFKMYKWGLWAKGKLASKVWLRMITTSTWKQCELTWKFNQKKYNLEKASYCVEHVDSLDHSNPKALSLEIGQ